MLGDVPPGAPDLELRGAALRGGVVMAIVNRTTDSFYAPARFPDDAAALDAVARAADDGAQIVDVGGVRAGVGPEISVAEEIDRVVPFVAQVRAQVPDILVSVDTWRSEVAAAAVSAGADLLNDTWAGHDPALVEVAGRHGVGVVCSHTGGLPPRTDPHHVSFPLPADAPAGTDPQDGVVLDVLQTLRRAAERAVACGVPSASVLVDPTHDFGKTTANSLRLVRRADALVALGYPVLMALSRKDFVGETLDLPADLRLEGTLAATAVAAWLGVRVFRTHDVLATRRTLDLVAAVRGELAPRAPRRGL
ncbi:dihydropteroate synthase [Flavimobilis marinus]|uniref:Dihydropteroate synthase n=1 Tax=Flavimobilis marinus TaxID=285351 RepID=A0A1I2DPB1_9MICO|nr:dihydropteroate synthase [Flavimobilis marinus]GHG44730.1 dihydropteroate synthase [Flavimobilis marinus]SFE82171.1 Dihydropteroate synthase [Flavimobilis marinus]